uniref:Cnidarian restricted protein n=1 Tax=Clytia hemisphaerica TaxID=252671 RepID=A0A7M5VAS2_9CNID
MLKIIFILGYISFGSRVLGSCRCKFPPWKDGFSWSENGPIADMTCIEITEPNDHDWNNNYFCQQKANFKEIGMQWSSAGPIPSMRCIRIIENDDTDGWDDNFLCVPHESPLPL